MTDATPLAEPSGYLRFLVANRRFVAFGFLVALSSSFGQTYFIGIFGPALREVFALSHTGWGTVYLVGTVASALLLPFSGRLIDRFDLTHYSYAVCALAAVACALMASAQSVWMLTLAIFALRHAGQGLLSHVAVTSMARYYTAARGRAIAFATLGFAAGEALLPLAAVYGIDALGWRATYLTAALAMVLVLLPAFAWLLRGHAARHAAYAERVQIAAVPDGATTDTALAATRADVLRDPRFYLLLPGVLAPAFVVTALFFHQLLLADAKGWSAAWVTGNYVVYAAVTTLVSLACGPLIDRIGAVRLVPWMPLPMVLSLVVVATFDGQWVAWPYLGLLGVNVGIAHTSVSAMWAELYGTRHLGAVRSMTVSIAVFASALGPVTVGAIVDAGFGIEQACLAMAAYTAVATVLLFMALRSPRPAVSA